MTEAKIPLAIQQEVLNAIASMGYSRYLQGIRPKTLEGKIVSDADMCDAIGATGILRVFAYGRSVGQPIFNKEVFPASLMPVEVYRTKGSAHTINHFFDKLLRLKDLMLTEPGKKEAKILHQLMLTFLKQFFIEQEAPSWLPLLDAFKI